MRRLLIASLLVTACGTSTVLHATDAVMKGDVRFRYANEITNGLGNTGSATGRERLRTRVRYGVEKDVNDQVKAVVRFATGGGSFSSTNADLTFAKFADTTYGAYVDLAYLAYTPYESPMTVFAGKMPNPFKSTILLWDGDTNFPGLATTVKMGAIDLGLGIFPVTENNSIGNREDAVLIGTQMGYAQALGDESSLSVYGSYYSIGGDAACLDRIVEGIAEYKINSSTSVIADAFKNFRSDNVTDKTIGYYVEGKTKLSEAVKVSLGYGSVQTNALTNQIFGDSDFRSLIGSASVNNNGVKATLGFTPFKDNELSVAAFMTSNIDGSGTGSTIGSQTVILADWVVKI